MADTISEENFLGTDEDGTSYYADDNGNIAAVASDGTVTTANANDAPDSDNYDGTVGTYNTDTSSEYTFDDNGNLVDQDTGKQVDTSHWTDVIGVATEQDGKTTPVAGYTYAGTDKNGNPVYSNPAGRNFTEEMLMEQAKYDPNGLPYGAKDAQNLATTYGPSAMNPDVLNAYKENPETMKEVLANAADGNPAAQALAAAMTGTVPTNITDDRVYEMLADMEDRIAKGEDVKSAYTNAGNKVGLTDDMSSLKTIIELIGPSLILGPLAAAGAKAVGANRITQLLNAASKAKGTRRGAVAAENAMHYMAEGSKLAGLATGATGAAGVGLGAAGVATGGSASTGSGGSSNPYNQPNQAAQDIINGRTREEESGDDKLAAAETTRASTPETTSTRTDTSKTDTLTFSNPFGTSDPDPTGYHPDSPLSGTTLSGVGLPEPEDPNAGKERGFEDENSDSGGDDTLETTTQDAPTGGVGTDTFVNTNDDTRRGWGLGEEDPNRANYDIDKWNRGMERVSTDVVSDAKVKNFITKTFKDDPVLMKTVKIMKSKK